MKNNQIEMEKINFFTGKKNMKSVKLTAKMKITI